MKKMIIALVLAATINLLAEGDKKPMFYCSFESMEDITRLGGSTSSAATFVKGVKGQALDLKDKLGCSFPSAKTITAKEGTLAAWIRPNWDLRDLKSPRKRLFAVINIEQKTKPVHLYNYFCILGSSYGNLKEGVPYQLYCLARKTKQEQGSLLIPDASWNKGTWQHVAVSWRIGTGKKDGEFNFYLNGELVGRRTDFRAVKIAMGKKLSCAPGGVLDELKIWDSILSEDEVKKDFSSNKQN